MKRAAAIIICLFALTSCKGDERPEPGFKPGQMVRMKAFGNEGMVVDAWCNPVKYGGECFYHVRFNALQITTNTRLWGGDRPVDFAPVALVRDIRQFELEEVR